MSSTPHVSCVDGKKERKKKGGYWEQTINRRVQHFGYRFNYETRTLDAPRNMCPIPACITELVQNKLLAQEKVQQQQEGGEGAKEEEKQTGDSVKEKEEKEGVEWTGSVMTQMTINEYYPGQGIASHLGR